MTNIKKYIALLILVVSLFLTAQTASYNHSELKWLSFETEHFVFLYHQGTEKSVNRFANVAEHVFEQITDLYRYKPEQKMYVIVNDYDDFANGGAYYYNNKIHLWAPNLDYDLRGTHNWFKNLFTHEFSHMIQLQTAKKTVDNIPGIYLQNTSYEPDKRRDILTGYPSVLASFSIPMNVIPGWFAEGVAQNQDYGRFNFDFWDANRDMNFRERLLSGQAFSYEKLQDFGNKTSHEGETVYNTGMAFVSYMFDRFGKDVGSRISFEMGKPLTYNFDTAIHTATGTEAKALYNEFLKEKEKEYREKLKNVNENLVSGTDISDSAFVNSHPVLSPDGTKLAFLSTKETGEVTFYRRGLFLKDLKTDSVKMLAPYVGVSGLSWSPCGQYVYYGRVDKYSKYGNLFYDLYKWDIAKEEEIRLTEGLRALNPAVSPDSTTIAFVASKDGTQNLYLLNEKTKEVKNLTNLTNGTQFYLPKWNKDGSKLVIARSDLNHGRDIVIFDRETGQIELEIKSPYDFRNPVFSDDDNYIYYSSDETGIFNIYRYNLNKQTKELVTNVRGGAFYPDVNSNTLYYINYHGIKMNLFKLADIKALDKKTAEYRDYKIPKGIDIPEKNYVKDSRLYHQVFEHPFILPRLSMDNGKFKPGLYFTLNDYLEKVSLFGTYAQDETGDYDLYGFTEFRFLYPTIYGSAIKVKRHDTSTFLDSTVIEVSGPIEYDDEGNPIPQFATNKIDYDYNITEYNVGLITPIPFSPEIFNYSLGALSFDSYFSYAQNEATAKYRGEDFSLNYTYYKNKGYNFKLNLNTPKYGLNSGISPDNGRDFYLKLTYNQSKFIQGFKINDDYGTLQEDYKDNNFWQLDLDWREFFGLTESLSLATRLNINWLFKDNIETFYNNYIGGLNGLRGYSFYSLGGSRTMLTSFHLRAPIIERTDYRFSYLSFFNFKKMYAGIFTDLGTTFRAEEDQFWQKPEDERYSTLVDNLKHNLKSDVGLSLRIYGVSFYNMPTTIDYSLAYGLNEFKDFDQNITYGKEFRHYFTLLFGFMDF